MKRHTYAQGRCPAGRQGGGSAAKWIGLTLMIIGGLILVIAVPVRYWIAAIGLVLAVAGFLLWRFAK